MSRFLHERTRILLPGLVFMAAISPAQAALAPEQTTLSSQQVQAWEQLAQEAITAQAQAFGAHFGQACRTQGLKPTDEDLREALGVAAYRASALGLWPAVQPLLQAGADPNLRMASDGDTALLAAARKASLSTTKDLEAKYEKVIQALLRGGAGPDHRETHADASLQDYHGNTALMILSRAGKGLRYAYLGLDPKARKATLQGNELAPGVSFPFHPVRERLASAPVHSTLIPEQPEGRDALQLRDLLAKLLQYTQAEDKDTLVSEFCHYAQHGSEIMGLMEDPDRFSAAVVDLQIPGRFKNPLFGKNRAEQEDCRRLFSHLFYTSSHYIKVIESDNYNSVTLKEMGAGLDRINGILKPMLEDPYFEQRISSNFKALAASLSHFSPELGGGLGRTAIKKFIERYYVDNSNYNRRCLLAAFLQNEREPNPERQLHQLLGHAGPLLQHLLQVFSEASTSAAERDRLAALGANLPALDPGDLELAKKRDVGPSFQELFPTFDPVPVAVTPQCQFHRATHQGQDILLKLKKPFSSARAEDEFALLQIWLGRLAVPRSVDSMTQLWKDALAQELDFDRERQLLTESHAHYADAALGLVVLEPDQDLKPKGALVLKLARPDQARKREADTWNPCDKKALLLNLFGKWLNTAIFEDGFLDTDLKECSLLFDTAARAPQPNELILLNSTCTRQLSPATQKAIVLLFAGLEQRKPEVILSGFQAMAPLSKAQTEEVSGLIHRELAAPGPSSRHFGALLDGARHLAVPMDDGVLAFNTGRLHLERQLEAYQRLLKGTALQDCVPRTLASVYQETFSKILRTSKTLLGPELGKPR